MTKYKLNDDPSIDRLLRAAAKKESTLQNAQFCFSTRRAKILTGGIHGVFRGLRFEPNVEMGQKGVFCKGLNQSLTEHTEFTEKIECGSGVPPRKSENHF